MSGLDSIWVATAESQLSGLTNKVDSLQTRLDQLQEKTDMLSGIIETSNDSIANQLAASNNLLALVGLVIAVAGVILGIFISRKKKEMDDSQLSDQEKEEQKCQMKQCLEVYIQGAKDEMRAKGRMRMASI